MVWEFNKMMFIVMGFLLISCKPGFEKVKIYGTVNDKNKIPQRDINIKLVFWTYKKDISESIHSTVFVKTKSDGSYSASFPNAEAVDVIVDDENCKCEKKSITLTSSERRIDFICY